VSLAICAALKRRGLSVQPFKKGPDFIDPMWLSAAAGRDCHNLDFNTMPDDEIQALFVRHAKDADIAVIEGNNGLYDGTDIEGGNSNAAMAKLLGAPVVLVVDCAGMARGIAPLLIGYRAFDERVRIGAVVLNNVAGDRHESKLRAAIERFTQIPVLGAIRRGEIMPIAERHLGLVPTAEWGADDGQLATAADTIEGQLDLDMLLDLAGRADLPPVRPAAIPAVPAPDIRIGIARDSAFGFYYAGDLEALKAAGAEPVFFDCLRDPHLPSVDGLFIGGGFPETHIRRLEANQSLRRDIADAIEGGMPAYAECGGLMYLARSIEWQGDIGNMVGVIPAKVVVHKRPRGHGYVRLIETAAAPWPAADGAPAPSGQAVPGHEFHYSDLRGLDGDPLFAYEMARGHGIDGRHDGLVYKNLLASYAHLRDTAGNPWTRRFVAFVRSCKTKS
ncbi:MAG: cobyrinate a,c-diamide synthase, partial [Rhodospirillales bacterium]|nr:cobyrinate a,c-diamide synthase [Rhodospirillales bacterium]